MTLCLTQGPQRNDAVEARTRGPLVSSQALKHCAPKINYVLQSLNIVIILTNSAGPDEMQHNAAFHLGLHCLPKGFPVYKGLNVSLF